MSADCSCPGGARTADGAPADLEDDVAETEEPDDHRLTGRMPRRQVDQAVAAAVGKWREQSDPVPDGPEDLDEAGGDGAVDDVELDAVTRLMGFLRDSD